MRRFVNCIHVLACFIMVTSGCLGGKSQNVSWPGKDTPRVRQCFEQGLRDYRLALGDLALDGLLSIGGVNRTYCQIPCVLEALIEMGEEIVPYLQSQAASSDPVRGLLAANCITIIEGGTVHRGKPKEDAESGVLLVWYAVVLNTAP